MTSKVKTSMTICKHFNKVWRAGYCDLSEIMRGYDPVYFNRGVYGWNCDLYTDYEHSAIITTGYRNMRGARIPSDLIKKYTDIAKQYTGANYDSEKLEANRRAFLSELDTL